MQVLYALGASDNQLLRMVRTLSRSQRHYPRARLCRRRHPAGPQPGFEKNRFNETQLRQTTPKDDKIARATRQLWIFP
jgi:hypothetical protein